MKTPERSVEETIVISVYNEVLRAAKPLYDVDSTHVEVAIFEEDVYRRIEKTLTQTLQAERQRCEEMVEAEREETQELAELAKLLGCKWAYHSNLHIGKAKYYFNGAYITEDAIKTLTHPNNK